MIAHTVLIVVGFPNLFSWQMRRKKYAQCPQTQIKEVGVGWEKGRRLAMTWNDIYVDADFSQTMPRFPSHCLHVG